MNMAGIAVGRNGKPIIANVDRLHDLMDREGLTGIVVRGGQYVTYLADIAYHGTLGRHLDLSASPRGVLVIWPRHGEPAILVDGIAAGVTERDVGSNALRSMTATTNRCSKRLE